MSWPTSPVATGDLITAAQLNLLPIRIGDSGEIGSAQASIDFSSIPAGFANLMLMIYARSAGSYTTGTLSVRLNGDSGSNYDLSRIYQESGTVGGDNLTGRSGFQCDGLAGASATAHVFSAFRFVLLDYAGTSNYKAGLLDGGTEAPNGIMYEAGRWNNTAAVNEITVASDDGSNLAAGSRAMLYAMP